MNKGHECTKKPQKVKKKKEHNKRQHKEREDNTKTRPGCFIHSVYMETMKRTLKMNEIQDLTALAQHTTAV